MYKFVILLPLLFGCQSDENMRAEIKQANAVMKKAEVIIIKLSKALDSEIANNKELLSLNKDLLSAGNACVNKLREANNLLEKRM